MTTAVGKRRHNGGAVASQRRAAARLGLTHAEYLDRLAAGLRCCCTCRRWLDRATAFHGSSYACKTCKNLIRNAVRPLRCPMCERPGEDRSLCPECTEWRDRYHAVTHWLGLNYPSGPGLPADEMERRIRHYAARAEAGKPLFQGEVGA